jgi:hypothetical protein
MWKEIRPACRAILADGSLFLLCLLMLSIVDYALAISSIPDGHIEILESLHFDATYACILIMATGTLTRLVLHVIERTK